MASDTVLEPAALEPTMLELHGLRVRYGPLEALHGVSLTLTQGEAAAVVGRNGAGKTSLLRAIAGTVKASEGRIVWQGSDIQRAPIGRRAAQGIMLIPDEGGVFRTLTVRENLELFAQSSQRTAIDPAVDAFPALGDLMSRRALLLSGGEQQMLALSRALLAPWRLLLVDELSHGLAPALATRLYAVLADLAARTHRAVLLAEPDASQALGLAQRIHVLRRGEIAASTAPERFDPVSL
jgi:branched-chain amino acid transport system ATP-binding protein